MLDSEFTAIETAIVDEIRPLEHVEVRYLLSEDGMALFERSEHRGPNSELSPEIVGRLEGGEKMRLIRNEPTNSGLSLQDILLLERFPGVLEVVVVTASGSTYRAATHEWHAEDNMLRRLRQTIMRLSAGLSLLITPGSVEDPELRILADRMPRHYLAQRLSEVGAIEYRANQSPEDALIVAGLYKTPLRERWSRILLKEIC